MLGVRTTARLSDCRVIIVFVIGGISLAETRELRQLAAQHPSYTLLVGATGVASARSVSEMLTYGLSVS